MGEPAGGIREFYADRCVFITGATGYLGKVTVEKLLYSCPEIDKVYMLVRPKRGKTSDERLKELLKSRVFDRLKKEQMSFASKIVLINGDMEAPGMNIDPADVERLISDTSVIIHNAATIRFTEKLKAAVRINVSGLLEMINLAKKMKKLQAFVHISTAYSNCILPNIDEKIYPQDISPQQLISATNWLTDEQLYTMYPWILKEYPNTYTYTKVVGELLLEQEKGDIPAAIIRPSMIIAGHTDPVPGWVDDLSAMNLFRALSGVGLLRKMQGCYDNIADLVPVDMVANSSIVAGWMLAKDKPRDVFVVNMTSGQLNPITYDDCFVDWYEDAIHYPTKNVVRPPNKYLFFRKMWMVNISKILDHKIPAMFFDLLAKITGNPAKARKSVRHCFMFADITKYFSNRQWVFENKNTKAMIKAIPGHEQKVFNVDVTCVDWRSFSRVWWMGIREYAWREDLSKQYEYDRHYARIVMRRRLVRAAFGLLVMSAVAAGVTGRPVLIEDGVVPVWNKLVSKAKELFHWGAGDRGAIDINPRILYSGIAQT